MNPKQLKDVLHAFLDAMPDDEDLQTKQVPEGPLPTTYIGRPAWCGGALLRRMSVTGEWVDRRVSCGSNAEPGYALCSACSGLETKERQEHKAKAAESQTKATVQTVSTQSGIIPRRTGKAKP